MIEHAAARPTADLMPYLACFGRRLRLRDGWLLAQRSLWAACAAMVGVQIAGRMWPISRLGLWTLAPLAVWLATIVGRSILCPMSPSRVARRTDAELGLKERLSTAIGLEDWRIGRLEDGTSLQPSSFPAFQPSLVALQKEDALAVAQAIEPRRAFPLSWRRRPLLIACLLVVATVVLAVLPNRMDEVLAERAEIARRAGEQAERLERLGDEIARAQELSPEDREKLQRQLAELAERLRQNRGDREQALADLSRLEESLRREIDPNADARQAALDALAAQLQALAGEEGGERADPADMDEASRLPDETLRSLAETLAGAGEEERQALSDALGQMAARAAQAGDQDLAQALADLARAAQGVGQAGDAEAASRAAQAADAVAGAMRRAQSELAGQAARQRALSQLQQGRESLAAAGSERQTGDQESPSEAQSPSGGQAPGQGQSGRGQQAGQGQGQGQSGQGTGGQGTKADQLPPGTGRGQADRPQGEGRPGGVGELDQQVYVPMERRQGSGDEVAISGQDTGQGETEVRERTDPLPGEPGEALVPYYEVYYEYLDAANEAIEQSYIPSGLKEVVREYFTRLEP